MDELLDRVHIIREMFYDYVVGHMNAGDDGDVSNQIGQIGERLNRLYQTIGTVSYNQSLEANAGPIPSS